MKALKKVRVPLLAFLLPALCFIIFLALYGVLGYGNYTILRGDLYVQYVDFIQLFLRALKGKEDFWYTFSQYFGQPSVLTYAYYCFSPFNLLYLLDFISVPAMTAAIITMKIGLCGTAFSVFAKKALKCSDAAAVFFALCYALNNFNVVFHFDMIWLESAYLLPIIILLIVKLVREGRSPLLIPAWILLFLSNFYMAYIVGVFSALVFLALLFLKARKNAAEWKEAFFLCLRFTSSVVLAAGCCAAILLPSAKYLLSHIAADNFDFIPLENNIFDTANALMMGVMPDVDNRTPLIYCGLPVLLFLPFYFFRKSIPLRERVLSGLLLLFSFLSLVWLPVFIFMHAFDYPNFYFFRNSASVCFLLCVLACRVFTESRGTLSTKKLWPYIAGLICLYSFMINFWPMHRSYSDVTNSAGEMAVNIVFLVIWGFLLTPSAKPLPDCPKRRRILTACLFLLLCTELTLQAHLAASHMDLTPISEAEYNSWYNAQKSILSSIPEDDNDLYRIAMYGDNNYNSSAFYGYNSFNTFSSSDDYELRYALFNLGIAAVNRSITENGYTDLTYMLFDAAYTGNITAVNDDDSNRVSELTPFPYRLSIGYMVSDGILSYEAGPDPFENQERFANAISGHSYHFFDRLAMEDVDASSYNADMRTIGNYTFYYKKTSMLPTSGVYYTVKQEPDRPFMVCFRQNDPSATLNSAYLIGSRDCFAVSLPFSSGCIVKAGAMPDDFGPDTETAIIYFSSDSDSDVYCSDIFFARYNPDDLPKLHADLLPGTLKVHEHSTSRIVGSVTATEDRPILFTSIPWDEGWCAWVDGQEAAVENVMGSAFLSLRLTPGEHEVELRYIAPGSKAGMIVSLVSLLLAIVYMVISGRPKKTA
ncbi:MAG: YfhO family protein [Lachnospiraceae bacterium]|nr:YfhO family protein [Lachnospiraceae bacterium]